MSTNSLEPEIFSKTEEYAFTTNWYDIASEDHFWMVWRCEAFMRQIRDVGMPLDKELRGLEVGCGHGVFRSQVEDRTAWVVDGVDLNMHSLRKNKKCRGRILFYNILDRKKEFEHLYDFIILFDVIEHIGETMPFIEACLYHLKPGGHVFVNVPALQSLFGAYDRAAGHIRRYNRLTLTRELEVCGLRIIRCWYWGSLMIPVLVLRNAVTLFDRDPEKIIQKGFAPPGPGINNFFKKLIVIENALFRRPSIGTSVMATAVKP